MRRHCILCNEYIKGEPVFATTHASAAQAAEPTTLLCTSRALANSADRFDAPQRTEQTITRRSTINQPCTNVGRLCHEHQPHADNTTDTHQKNGGKKLRLVTYRWSVYCMVASHLKGVMTERASNSVNPHIFFYLKAIIPARNCIKYYLLKLFVK